MNDKQGKDDNKLFPIRKWALYHTAPRVDGANMDLKFKFLEIILKQCFILLGNETWKKKTPTHDYDYIWAIRQMKRKKKAKVCVFWKWGFGSCLSIGKVLAPHTLATRDNNLRIHTPDCFFSMSVYISICQHTHSYLLVWGYWQVTLLCILRYYLVIIC